MSFPNLQRVPDVVRAIFGSKGTNQFVWITAAIGAIAYALILLLLSGDTAGAIGQYVVAIMAGTGGFLWLWRPPRTFEPDRGPAISLLGWASAKTIGATFWLLEGTYGGLAFLQYAGSFYVDLVFITLFFTTARPRASVFDRQ